MLDEVELRRDLGLGVLLTPESKGVRLEVDVVARDGWSLGVTVGLATSTQRLGDDITGASLVYEDLRGAVVVAKTLARGPWRLRVQAGAGVVQTDYTGVLMPSPLFAVQAEGKTDAKRMYEGAVTVAYAVDRAWSVAAGPLLSSYNQTFTILADTAQQEVSRDHELGAWLAIKKQL